MTRIDPACVKARLMTCTLGRNLVFYEETASTNADAKELGRLGAPHGTLVFCAQQTAGRGRRGRSWFSEDNAICLTVLLRPPFPMKLAPRYVIACAVGVCKALRSFGVDARIKWPNDITADGKKLCGILCEADTSNFVAAGIGVNVNQKEFPEDIAATAASLYTATGMQVNPNDVIVRILEECEPLFDACGSEERYAALLETYKSLSKTLGSHVLVVAPIGEYEGIAVDLDALGMLVVKKNSGEIVTVSAGDVSIRDPAL